MNLEKGVPEELEGSTMYAYETQYKDALKKMTDKQLVTLHGLNNQNFVKYVNNDASPDHIAKIGVNMELLKKEILKRMRKGRT